MPGTETVLGLNLTRNCFFFQTRKVLFQIKLSVNYLSAYLLSSWLSHLGIVIFCFAHVSLRLLLVFDILFFFIY